MKNILKIQFLCLCALFFAVNMAAQQKAAFITSAASLAELQASGDDDEKAAATWFAAQYPSPAGTILSTQNARDWDLSQYSVIWIAIDRVGIGNDLPSDFTNPVVVDKIRNYYQSGGNLLLTNHATRYLLNLGRTTRFPGIWGDGAGFSNADTWGINTVIGSIYDHSASFLYQGMNIDFIEGASKKVYNLIGAGYKEDHNSMWDLNAFGYSGIPNTVANFENENNATVLATWQHVTDFCCAGIVDFHSVGAFGRCIAIGVAAYEWNQNDAVNPYQSNIERLTKNALEELMNTTHSGGGNDGEATLVAHFPMDLNANGTSINETVADRSFTVESARPIRENVAGAVGQALRFDGYSTFASGQFEVQNLSNQAISAEIWVAMENYPMMDVDGASNDFTMIAGNLKSAQNSGFGFVMNTRGDYGFRVYIDGREYTCIATTRLPRYQWAHMMATVDMATRRITLWINGVRTRITNISGSEISVGTRPLIIGKSFEDITIGNMKLNTINGLVDEFKIYSGILPDPSVLPVPENPAYLTIPATRFQDEIQRPILRGMPAAGWTNEPHGLIYHNGMWHNFFQKNGNGPYWGQIIWGHIVSQDLINWTEVRPALFNDNPYDSKGVWSGCIFQDDSFNNGKPTIFYTGVDLSRASIVTAVPNDNSLMDWTKQGQIVPHRPAGLSDDFRDPYVFKANGNIYMIVGTSKDNRGAVTLHRYNPSNNSWSNTGEIFYQGTHADYGNFWEMPVVLEMEPGKWLFAACPLGMAGGVQMLYWVGTINANGTFSPYTNIPKEIDLGDMSKEGFGMLAPTVAKHDGKFIAIGIVPDMAAQDVFSRGWTHTFSLPREWSLDAQNNLVQKPYAGFAAARNTTENYVRENFTLNGAESLTPVTGKTLELLGEFKISGNINQIFGFNVRKNGGAAIKIFYNRSNNHITVDATSVPRIVNDARVFNGLYTTALPETFAAGDIIKIHAFIDHSVMDIFINDKWAFSIRIFPTDADANDVEVTAVNTEIRKVEAWMLSHSAPPSSIVPPAETTDKEVFFIDNRLHFRNISENAQIVVYDMMGKTVFSQRYLSDDIYLPKNKIYIARIMEGNDVITKKIISF